MGYRNGESKVTIQILQQSNLRVSDYITVSITVPLEGADQLVLDTFNYESVWNQSGSSNWTYVQKEPLKFMLNSIEYTLSDTEFSINYIKATGFRKDKKLRARESYFHATNPQFQDLVKQIPDHFHDKARAEFDKVTEGLIDRLTIAKQKGLTIK